MPSLVCPIVVGRERQLAQIGQTIDTSLLGRGSAVFVLGEAGIGKTRLTSEAETLARDAGLRVLRGRAVQGGAQVPFRPFAEAFQAAFRSMAPPSRSELGPFWSVIGHVVPAWAAMQSSSEANPIVLFDAVVYLVDLLSRERGALLVLEDLHWADAETLSALEFLVDHITDKRCVCIVTGRTDEPTESARVLDGIARRVPATRIVLSRLKRSEVAEVARLMIGEDDLDERLVEAVERRSAGVPLLVEELSLAWAEAHDATEEARPDVLGTLPESYAAIVLSRLARLRTTSRQVVEAAAALGARFDTAALEAVTGCEPHIVSEAFRDGIDGGLIVEDRSEQVLQFRHALVADAVLAALLPDQRRELFLRTADAIALTFPGYPGEWCERAAELRMAGGDAEQASALLIEAGRRAIKRGALLTAVRALERARLLVKGDRWKTTGVDRVLVRALALVGDTERMHELGEHALAFMGGRPDLLGTNDRIVDLQLSIARGLASSGNWEMAADHLALVQGLVVEAADPDVGVRARSLEARVAVALGDADRAAELNASVLTDEAAPGLPEVVCETIETRARLALVGDDPDGAVSLLHQMKAVAERRDLTLWRIESLLELAVLDEVTSASLANVDAAAELVPLVEAPLAQVRVDMATARIRLARFELGPAGMALRRALDTCNRYQLPLLGHALVVEAELAALDGGASAGGASRHHRPDRPRHMTVDGAADGAAAIAALVKEDRKVASDRLHAVQPSLPPDRWAVQSWYRDLASLVDALGESTNDHPPSSSGIRNVADAFAELAAAVRYGQLGEKGDARERFERADAFLEPFPWRRHLARRLVAEAAIADGWGQPVEWLAGSLAFFDAAGHTQIAAAIKGLQRRAGVTVPRRSRGSSPVPPALRALAITAREMDVLNLLAQGLANADIAHRLYLSVRTVESHVASTLRKTGAQSRTALVALVLGADDDRGA